MWRYIAVAATVVVASNLAQTQRIQTVEVGSNKYFISNASPYAPTLNWFLAYQYCRTIGMELLTFNTIEKTEQLTGFLRENNYNAADYWTSGNQLGSAMWIWMSTGQPYNATFNAWAAGGPPLTKSSQSCMGVKSGVWSAENCMDSKAFICELTRCFYFNYVTTNKAPINTQGKVPDRLNQKPLSPIRSTTITGAVIKNKKPPTIAHSKIEELVKRPPPLVKRMKKPINTTTPASAVFRRQPPRKTTTASRPFRITISRHNEPNKFMPTTQRPIKVMPTTQRPIKVMPTTQRPIKFMPTTQQPIKVMPTTQQPIKVMPTTQQLSKTMPATQQSVKVMPTTVKNMPGQAVKEMPLVISDSPTVSTLQNEILPKEFENIAKMIPPVYDYQTKDTTSASEMTALERKEMFSWALKGQ